MGRYAVSRGRRLQAHRNCTGRSRGRHARRPRRLPKRPHAAPTEPQTIGMDKINSGDTAWMLTSTALVLMMTIPGLALFYGGMVRKKNVLATLMQSFAITCMVTLLWWLIGYSWAFTPGSRLSRRSRVALCSMA